MKSETHPRRRRASPRGSALVCCGASPLLHHAARSVAGDGGRGGLRRVAVVAALHPDVVLTFVEVCPAAVGVPVEDGRSYADGRGPSDVPELGDGFRRPRAGLVDRHQLEDDDARDERDECGQHHRHPGDRPHALHAVALGEGHGEDDLAVCEPAEE